MPSILLVFKCKFGVISPFNWCLNNHGNCRTTNIQWGAVEPVRRQMLGSDLSTRGSRYS